MIKKFERYIVENQLFEKTDKLLVAVSGGIDSMVLCYLLHQAGYNFAIAHCNFQLRGEESDEDENFVKEYAKKIAVKCFTKRFNTEGVAKKQKKGIQEIARQLRYAWFDEISQNNDYQYIVTAHHASDNIETFIFNFSRGTGIKGLKGILPKNEHIARPLLWAKKEDIIAFATIKKIAFREDTSNATDKYKRNFIRHHVIPALNSVNINFEENATETIVLLQEAQVLLNRYLLDIKSKIIKNIDNQIFIDKKLLFQYPSVLTILFEILKDAGFNTSQVRQIMYDASDKTKVGTKFYSESHVLLVDREYYIVQTIEKNIDIPNSYEINEKDSGLDLNKGCLKIEKRAANTGMLSKNQYQAQLDFNRLSFPLTLRHWQKGDFFHPLGMEGKRQKLSDFFQNQKLTDFEKEKVWILTTSKNEICWVAGFRIDERFKINENTKYCYSIDYEIKSDGG